MMLRAAAATSLALALLLAGSPALVRFPAQDAGAVLVTGTSSGIGRSAAIGLCARGFKVLATLRSPTTEEMGAFRNDAVAHGCLPANLHFFSLEVTNATERQLAFRTLLDFKLRVAAIVNNAGISYDLPLELMREEDLRRVMEINFFAPMLLIREAIPILKADKGRIVTVGSIAGRVAAPGQALYAASKHALEGLHDSLRRELLEWGVSVSMIDPGCVQSNIFGKSILQGDPSSKLSRDKYELYSRHFKQRDVLLGICQQFAMRPDDSSTPDIVHAVTAPYPRPRYFPGNYGPLLSGRMLVFLNWLTPERLLDLSMSSQLPGLFK